MTDRQVIVQLGFDPIITRNTIALNSKVHSPPIPSQIVEVHPGSGSGIAVFRYADVRILKQAFTQLTANSRVYLQGHGDWVNQKLEDYNGALIALLLKTAEMPNVRVVSVLGCSLARNDQSAIVRINNSLDSFAATLHAELRGRGIITEVYARSYDVAIEKAIPKFGLDVGRKVTADVDDFQTFGGAVHHRIDSKYRYYWNGQTQMRALVY